MQNINLYLPELRDKQEWLTAYSLGLSCIGFIIVLLIAGFVNQHRLNAFEESLDTLELAVAASTGRVESIRNRAPAGNSIKLDQQLEHLRAAVASRLLVKDLIEGQSLGNNDGYSSRLAVLAQYSRDQFSLNRFRFSRGASLVELAGVTTQPESVVVLADQLKTNTPYEEASFGVLTMQPNVKRRSQFLFHFGYEPLFTAEGDLK
ncbi:hypothetical protein [Agaribacterium sp. ZY112]|uniref:hypothetical protein n=1 Tax=Agaribacterium sp. ZY112 TaxID=3233574 RepID=UPI003526B709